MTADGHLTPTELRVLHLKAQGLTSLEAAGRLGVSDQTVKNHMTGVYEALGVDSLASALAAVGWLKVPDAPPVVSEWCQWVGKCGRRYGHRGQHGGFRRIEENT